MFFLSLIKVILPQGRWEGHQENHLEILGMFPQDGVSGGFGLELCGSF